MKGIRTFQVSNKPTITINDSSEDPYHFTTEFGYQFLMITNDDDSASIEVSSDIDPE
jgi:nucleosome binding factor SPN SPT16 subunit